MGVKTKGGGRVLRRGVRKGRFKGVGLREKERRFREEGEGSPEKPLRTTSIPLPRDPQETDGVGMGRGRGQNKSESEREEGRSVGRGGESPPPWHRATDRARHDFQPVVVQSVEGCQLDVPHVHVGGDSCSCQVGTLATQNPCLSTRCTMVAK